MSRVSVGLRKQISLRLSPDVLTKIDQHRGRTSRDAWIERAVAEKLGREVWSDHE